MNVQARKDRENKEDKLKSTQHPQLISALDKESQLMKIAIIQPPITGDVPREKVTEFKFNMSQLCVVDKVDFFKQTSDLICSYLISTFISKDKLHGYFKKLENKLKTGSAEKKALLITKIELENNIIEINKSSGNETFNSLIQGKHAKIHNLKKKLKMPHDTHVQTIELKSILQEKEVLENELQNTKEIVGTFKNQNE